MIAFFAERIGYSRTICLQYEHEIDNTWNLHIIIIICVFYVSYYTENDVLKSRVNSLIKLEPLRGRLCSHRLVLSRNYFITSINSRCFIFTRTINYTWDLRECSSSMLKPALTKSSAMYPYKRYKTEHEHYQQHHLLVHVHPCLPVCLAVGKNTITL